MPAPVTPPEFKALIPDPSGSLCSNFKNVILKLPALLYKLINYMFDSSGNTSDALKSELSFVRTGFIMPSAILLEVSDNEEWLLCDGTAVNRADYPTLFEKIGTTYGAGNGTTTFNLPDLRDRAPFGVSASKGLGTTGGSDQVTMTLANLKQHSHSYTVPKDTVADTGQFGFMWEESSDGSGSVYSGTTGTAGSANPTPMEIQNPYLALHFYIKT